MKRPVGAGSRLGVLAVCLAAGLAACGKETPTAPSGPVIDLEQRNVPLAISAERYILEIQGADISNDPSVAACEPLLQPAGGKHVTTFVWFEQIGPDWIGRSRAPYAADLEVRLRRVGSQPGSVFVEGSISGRVPDEYDHVWGRRDSTFRTIGQASLDGAVSPGYGDGWLGHRVSGVLRGDLEFFDGRGRASCRAVRYFLEIRRPGGPDDDTSVPPLSGS
jgi:hypothetical protein